MLRLTKRETFKLNKNIRVDKTINKIADGIVKSIKDGIEKTSTDINGSGFAKLSPNTIASKKMRGLSYPKKPLYAEGKMEGINMTIKLKELMDKLWPGEDNGSEKIGRKTVLKRTNFWTKCALSGRDINLAARREEPGKGSLDHKIPRDQGGTSDLDNCQPLSVRMNQMKGNMTNEEFKEEIKFLYARFFLN